MGHFTKIGKRLPRAFTLVELLVVLTIVALLASLATPIVSSAILRAKESTLKENLYILRKTLDDYYADNGMYPENLDDLVEKKYLRKIPVDPMTDKNTSWRLKYDEENKNAGSVIDIYSGSLALASDQTYYAEW